MEFVVGWEIANDFFLFLMIVARKFPKFGGDEKTYDSEVWGKFNNRELRALKAAMFVLPLVKPALLHRAVKVIYNSTK